MLYYHHLGTLNCCAAHSDDSFCFLPDAFVDGTHSVPVDRAETFKWASLRLLDSKIVDERLSFEETKAVTAHLSKNFPAIFSFVSEAQLHRFVMGTPVTVLPTAVQTVGQDVPDDLMYERGIDSDECTLVLSGKVTVIAGQDNFRSDVSSWSVLAGNALTSKPYKPDFTAFVSSGPCRCLKILRSQFESAMEASQLEKQDSSLHSVSKPLQPLPPSGSSLDGGSQHGPDGSSNRKAKFMTALKAVGRPDEKDRRAEKAKAASSRRLNDAGGGSSKTMPTVSEKPSEPPETPTVHKEEEIIFE
mmetsp:Transcript_27357/g.63244  ORF Transcript_27357/g.63244 Transcript_27357/m.63244 type:complete len:302 (+) Transcript_27357:579-1484(+)